MKRSVFNILTSVFVLIVLLVACTKELTDDILSIKTNIFSFSVNSNSNNLLVDESTTINLVLQENSIATEYSLVFKSSISGEFIYNGNSYTNGQKIAVLAGETIIQYKGLDEGNHLLSFTIYNSEEKPIVIVKELIVNFISPDDPSIDPLNFKIEAEATSNELLVNDSTTITANIIEGADVPDNTLYMLKLTSSLAGNFVVNGQQYTAGDELLVNPNGFSILYTGNLKGDHVVNLNITNSYDTPISKTKSITVTYTEDIQQGVPVIELNGENPLMLNVGDPYVELATVTDDKDENIELIFGGSFSGSTATAGTFERTYNAVDTDGNNAVEQKRTIIVQDENSIEIVSLTFVQDEIEELEVNQNLQLALEILPVDATNTFLIWESSNENLVTVNSEGLVTGIASGGPVTITATTTDGSEISASILINSVVIPYIPVEEIVVANTAFNMLVSTTREIQYSIIPSNATNQTVLFESANPAFASVNANGLVTGNSIGETQITLSIEGEQATAEIEVTVEENTVDVISVEITAPTTTVDVGASLQLTAQINPENATDNSVIWSTSDATVATVNALGVVTGISSDLVEITVTTNDGAKTDSIEITVSAVQVEEVEIINAVSTIIVGEIRDFNVNILPENATDKSVVWSSSDDSVATVNASTGEVTALSTGEVTITVETEDGRLEDSVEVLIEPIPNNNPNADISVSETTGVVPFTVFFEGSGSDDPDGDTLTFEWFENLSLTPFDTNENTSRTFTIPGNYVITLKVSDGKGGEDSITETIVVNASNNDPIANIQATTNSGTAPLTVGFNGTGSSDPDGDNLIYEWTIDDVVFSNSAETFRTFDTEGNYEVRLSVSDGKGGVDSITETIVVDPPNNDPVARFVVTPISGTTNDTFVFDASNSFDPDGDSLTYIWSRFRGQEVPIIETSFSSAGQYLTTLTVRDGKGGESTTSVTITVTDPTNTPPEAIIEALDATTNTVAVGTTINFSSNSEDEDGDVLSHVWAIDGVNFSTTSSASRLFNTVGEFTISLTVDDGNGGTDTDTTVVTVFQPNRAPIANLAVSPTSGTTSTIFRFNGAGSSDPDGDPLTYRWPLVSSSTENTITRTFSSSGTYTTTIEVTDSSGVTDTASVTVTVTRVITCNPTSTQIIACNSSGGTWDLALCACVDNCGGQGEPACP